MIGPTKIIPDRYGDSPGNPVVESELGDPVTHPFPVRVKALRHQDEFERFLRPVPPLTDADRYLHETYTEAEYAALPTGRYDMDDAGNITELVID